MITLRPRKVTVRFQNKVALVTAAGSGIGKATAVILAKEGASLVAVDVNPLALKDLSKNMKAEGFFLRSSRAPPATSTAEVISNSQTL